ncbi:MAG: dihydrolipoamide acetyltransferase family protein [Terriglobia bacterium]
MSVNVIMPQMGESVAEGTITRWMKKVGDRLERDEPLFEISTDKVDAEIPSPSPGVLAKILVKESETVEVNTVVAVIENEAAEAAAAPEASSLDIGPVAAAAPPSAPVKDAESGGVRLPHHREDEIRSSPAVRKLAREHEVDLTQIQGTGLEGRISKKDVLAYISGRESAKVSPLVPEMPRVATPGPSIASPERGISFTGPTSMAPLSIMRQQIAEHMVMSKRTSPHVATVFEVEMTGVARLVKESAAEFERRNGFRLTYTPFFVRSVVDALKRFPIVNSSLDGHNVIYKRDVNIGIAVALETGLIVPVLRRADEMSFLGVARAVRDLAERARAKKLSVDEVQEGTFTISNHGVFGSLIGTPIINQPQVGILGVGAIEKRPVVRDDAIGIRSMVYLTLSFDHRVLDGAVADQFMAAIKKKLENWEEAVW